MLMEEWDAGVGCTVLLDWAREGGEVHSAFTNEGGGRIYCKLRGGLQDLISDFGDLHHNLPYDFGNLPPIYHLYHT